MSFIHEPYCNIQNFFENIEENFSSMENINNYDYKTIIDSYRNKLINMPFDEPKRIGDMYKHILHMQYGYYYAYWNIDKIKQVIEVSNCQQSLISTEDAYNLIGNNSIDPKTFVTYDTPIFIAQINCTSPGFIVIDGNHRVLGRYTKKYKSTRAYVLPVYLHIQAITSNYLKLIMAFDYNFWVIGNYIVGKINRNTFDKNLLRLKV